MTTDHATQQEEVAQRVLGAFRGSISPLPVSTGYRIAVILVALVMVLLPVVYVALIVGVSYLMYLHATHDLFLLKAVRGRAWIWAAILYGGVLVAGGVLILFMLRPLVTSFGRRTARRALDPRAEPLLFAFVDRLCQTVGAPRPSRIEVDCNVNASASFRAGLLGLLTNRLVLTIGLPLVVGLNLNQFAGVLAHEFGHFSQGASMRLSYLIRTINFWFYRMVNETGPWEALERKVSGEVGGEIGVAIALVVWLTKGFIAATRFILSVLMRVGHAASCFLMRQMELDADSYEARLVGAEVFASTTRQLHVLGAAHQGAMVDLVHSYRQQVLADDFPALVMANVGQIPAGFQEEIDRQLATAKTGWADTHPAASVRIAQAASYGGSPVFQYEAPAMILFNELSAVSAAATRDYYEELLGSAPPSDIKYAAVGQVVQLQQQSVAHTEALTAFFAGTFNWMRPLVLPAAVPAAESHESVVGQLRAATSAIERAKAAYETAFPVFDQADTQSIQAGQVQALRQAGFGVTAADFGLNSSVDGQLRKEQTAPQLEPLEQAVGARLAAALAFLELPDAEARLPGASQLREDLARILPIARALNSLIPQLVELRDTNAALGMLLPQTAKGNAEKLKAAIGSRSCRIVQWLAQARSDLATIQTIPADGGPTEPLGPTLVGELPDAGSPAAVQEAATRFFNRFAGLQGRLVGQLAAIAQQAEAAALK